MAENESMDYENEVVTLTDENGEESDYEIIGSLEDNGNDYLALVPVENDADEYIILKVVVDENDEEMLVTIDDDDEFDRIADMFDDELTAEYDYDDTDAPENNN